MRLLEAVPNLSEGRDAAKLARFREVASSVEGARLLDQHADADHHRSVYTIAGEPEAVVEAVFRLAAAALDLIDLRRHEGAHPRIGAADVLPLIPLRGLDQAEAVGLARSLASRLASELGLPVFLYGEAHPAGRGLPELRRGGLEALAREIAGARKPDFGPAALHPTAGAVVVGVRKPLVAFNVDLETRDLAAAKEIAKAIRESGGGLSGLRAIGVERRSLGRVQVSMNLTDLDKTGLARAFQAVRKEADRRGIAIAAGELVGLAPRQALVETAGELLKIPGFEPSARCLEDAIEKGGLPLDRAGFLDALASGEPIPGGGSAAALAGALAAALCAMVARVSGGPGAGSSRSVQVTVTDLTVASTLRDSPPPDRATLDALIEEAEFLRQALERLVEQDAEAYGRVVQAQRLPKGSPSERDARQARLSEALRRATSVPLASADLGLRALGLAELALRQGKPSVRCDAAIAAHLARACAEGSLALVRANLASLKDPAASREAAAESGRLGRELGEAWDRVAPLLP